MSEFEKLKQEIQNGLDGINSGISMGMPRLERYIGIRKKIYTVIFGSTGSGKSAYMHNNYILHPFDEYLKDKREDKKFKFILFSMERSKTYILAKWLSRKIFKEEGQFIPIAKMLGWWETKLTKDEHDLILAYEDYINELLEFVDILDGPINPTGAYKYVKEYAERTGRFEKIDEHKKIYIPNNDRLITMVGVDHFGLTKIENGLKTKKEAIDKMSEHFQWFRDALGYTPIGVSQINRNLSNPMYQKMESFEPTIDDLKESGRPSED